MTDENKAEPAAPDGEVRSDLEELQKKADEYLKMAQRVQADFSNYQKRVQRDREDMAKYQTEKLLADLLPALDTFSLALKAPATDAKSLVEGMKLAEREIFRKLESHGLKRIDASSGAFNPAVHEALMQVSTPDVPEGNIVAEMRPGYMLHERVLRPAQVSVATAPAR